jgi:hypothetical protein
MAELGSLTVRLNAVTADFEKKMGDAGKALDGINAKMALGVAKEFGQALVKAVKDVAEVMPELQAQLDELDKSWKKFLATAFGETFKSGVDLLEKFVKFSTDAANAWKDLSSYGIGKLMGMSDKELEAGLVATQNARTAKDNEIDFGGKATAPEVTLGIESMLTPAKDKWADAFKGFLWDSYSDALQSLADSGVGGFDFSNTDVGADIVEGIASEVEKASEKIDAESLAAHRRATQPLIDQATGDNLATTSQMSIAQGIGNKILGASGLAGTVTSNAIQAGMSGGGSAALASIGTDLLLSSAGFKGLMESINPLLQSFADVLGLVLIPLNIISPLFDTVADAIHDFVLSIYEFLDGIIGLDFSDEIEALGESAKKAKKNIDESFSSLNVPQGVKLALARYGATQPEASPWASSGVGSHTGAMGTLERGLVVQTANIYGISFEDAEKKLKDTAEREAYKQSGNMAGLGRQMSAWVAR